MFERLGKNGREFEEETKEHVNEYADAGLRTLILAYRKLSEEEYKTFNEKFLEAKNSISEDRETIIDEVTDNIEKDLILLGATAVEDKLQPGVNSMKPHNCFHALLIDLYWLIIDIFGCVLTFLFLFML